MKIEVWSDFVCPFCYIGKRRLEQALEAFPHRDHVHIEYKSYELAPESKTVTDKNIHEALAEKYHIPVEQAKAMNEQIGAQAKEVGLTYHFDDMKPVNTFDAHRLAKFAESHGKGREMTERILRAYFIESELISDHNTLARLAKEVGLDEAAVLDMLQSEKYTPKVRADQLTAREMGVEGVPFFVFNEKYAVSGAQPQEAFTEVLETVWQEERDRPVLNTLNPKSSKTSYCTGDSCEVDMNDNE
ncbi:DsbA family oxidoreductase [Lentibacillus saliphilus]|uniref:DsbA family oxidoreductase n=1 Tax=Lentibacillus saliphilus TaxID=2737028 RepID=UPI001C30E267|nr:DsbA family oxidoreductase [Lentibacillus saliphilus]